MHDLTALLLPETHRAKVRWSVLPFLRPTLERARRVVAIFRGHGARLALPLPGMRRAPASRATWASIPSSARARPRRWRRPGPSSARRRVFSSSPAPSSRASRVDTLLDAWEALRRDDPTTPPLVLAGPYGWRSPQLLRRMARLEPLGARYLGRVERERLLRLFQAARLFVYPSIYEGFGLPPAEALACGVPVVACAAASLPEVVGDAGELVEPRDAAALAGAIRRLLTDPAREAELRAAGGRAGGALLVGAGGGGDGGSFRGGSGMSKTALVVVVLSLVPASLAHGQTDGLAARVESAVERSTPTVTELRHRIHQNPELGYEEVGTAKLRRRAPARPRARGADRSRQDRRRRRCCAAASPGRWWRCAPTWTPCR